MTKNLQVAKQEPAKLNEDKGKFIISIISHDLRNVFQSLLGFSSLLIKELSNERDFAGGEIGIIARSIHNSSKAGFDLLENLQAWSRLQLERRLYQPELVELQRIAEDTIGFLKQVANTKQIELRNNIPPGLLVYADHNMLETIIRNLTSNAVKFTLEGGKVSISAKVDDETEWVQVEVVDTGVGISSEDQARLFDIGIKHSTAGPGDEKGTGLGLMICQELVDRHGGKIWVGESKLGQGTRIIFTVPANSGSQS